MSQWWARPVCLSYPISHIKGDSSGRAGPTNESNNGENYDCVCSSVSAWALKSPPTSYLVIMVVH